MKFSIVTAAFQSARFLRETAESVLSQAGDFEIEYIVVDGGSTDGTVQILRDIESQVAAGAYSGRCRAVHFRWRSEPDNGMYDAIRKGFSSATGDVFAWINSDDLYLPGAFSAVCRAFSAVPEVRWLKGITNYVNENSELVERGDGYRYARAWIRKGVYGRVTHFIQQDSVFWRAELWRKSGGVDSTFRFAGDFALWCRMAEHAPLVSLDIPLSCFRRVRGQLSADTGAYAAECERACPPSPFLDARIRLYDRLESRLPLWLRGLMFLLLFGPQQFRWIEHDRLRESFVRKIARQAL